MTFVNRQKKKKKVNTKSAGKTTSGKQLDLMDVGPKHSDEIESATETWKGIIKKRLALQAKEAEVKAELLSLLQAEKLTRLADGSIKCRCQGWILELKPVEEKLTATRVSE